MKFWDGMSRMALALVVWSGTAIDVVQAFASSHPLSSTGSCSRIVSRPAFFHSGEYDHDGPHHDALAHNMRRTDPKIFLTQRAIQSFIDLLMSTRDPHTVKWMEDNYDCAGLENYHGTGAFNLTLYPSWDALLVDMLHRPDDVVVVSAKRRGRGHGGWSANNPYLEDRWVEFNIDINPPSIVTRILSVREQIGKEWIKDLDTMVVANEQILSSYEEKSANARSEECLDADTENPEDCAIPTDGSKATFGKSKATAYDRVSMTLMDHTIEFTDLNSSPNRKGNFDLLTLLATQESIHRVLRQYREAGSERQVSFEWLRSFYVERVAKYFDGSQEFGRADDFLEELLLSPPVMKTVYKKVELVDPLRIAEDIIRTRSEVGQDWKEQMKDVPAMHMEIRKHLLLRQMGNAVNPSPFAMASTEQVIGSEGFE